MKHVVLLVVFLGSLAYANAQYKQPEYEKYPKQEILPKTEFDSIAAKQALGKGNVTLKGIMFTKARDGFGFKSLSGPRIKANHLVVTLFPLTPYYEEWYNLMKKERNLKKNKIVYMSNAAFRYRLTCETNERGEFTFPNMLPGKYILYGTLPLEYTGSYNQYTGSSYDSYGDQTDYYQTQSYAIDHNDSLMDIIEIKHGDKVVKANLRSSIGLDK